MLVNIKNKPPPNQYKRQRQAQSQANTDNTGQWSASMSAALTPQVLVGAAPSGMTLSARQQRGVCLLLVSHYFGVNNGTLLDLS